MPKPISDFWNDLWNDIVNVAQAIVPASLLDKLRVGNVDQSEVRSIIRSLKDYGIELSEKLGSKYDSILSRLQSIGNAKSVALSDIQKGQFGDLLKQKRIVETKKAKLDSTINDLDSIDPTSIKTNKDLAQIGEIESRLTNKFSGD